MRLLIQKNGVYTKGFVKWLLDVIRMELASNINLKKLRALNVYINELLADREDLPLKDINLNTALLVGIKHIHFTQTEKYFCIEINPKTFYPGTKYRVYKFCEFINYGNLDIAGCNVFTNVFSNIAENIVTYHNIYLLERGI